MHDRLPFDRAQTIHDLGEKLFTRIKDEQEQTLIRSFLAQALGTRLAASRPSGRSA